MSSFGKVRSRLQVCCCSVSRLCPAFCDLMDCTPGFPVSQSLLQFMSIESVIPSNHLILCCSLLLLPSIFLSIRVFLNESALWIRWPKYCNLSISPSNEYSGFISFRINRLILLSKGLWRVFSRTTIQKPQFFGAQPSLWSKSYICTWLLEKP